MIIRSQEQVIVARAIESVSGVRITLDRLSNRRLASDASRHLEAALTCLALLQYADERAHTVPPVKR